MQIGRGGTKSAIRVDLEGFENQMDRVLEVPLGELLAENRRWLQTVREEAGVKPTLDPRSLRGDLSIRVRL
jgi:hypothetical protein